LPAATAALESLQVALRAGHAEDDFSVIAAPEVG
jgi:hypothetical protein